MKKSRFNILFQQIMEETTKQEEQFKDLNAIVNSGDKFAKRELAATRRSLPLDIIKKLATDKDWEVRQNISRKKDLPLQVLRILATDKNWMIKTNIINRNDLPLQIINKLVNDNYNSFLVLESLIKAQKKLPIQIINKLANNKDNAIRKKLLFRKDLPKQIFEKIIKDLNYKQILDIPDLPLDIMEKASEDPDWHIRYELAKREDLPQNIIDKLADDKHKWVRYQIVHHNYSKLNQQQKNKFQNDKSEKVQYMFNHMNK